MGRPEITAGSLCRDATGAASAWCIALSTCDNEGMVRIAPLDPRENMATGGLPLEVEEADTAMGPNTVRIDRVGWREVASLVPVGRVSGKFLARIHRILATAEARAYSEVVHTRTPFRRGETPVPPSGKVIGAPELENLVEASLDGWLTTGRFNDSFQRRLGNFLGRRFVLTTNSGSSANLLALSSLTSHLLGERALKPGDEVITVAAGFPTTVNPIIQHGLIPVFVDVQIGTYNVDPERVAAAVTPRTRAIMVAHTLGNPFDLDAIGEIARRHDLWLVEDCCDALGSTYGGRKVGTFGHVGTLSFYPAHHITMGEGGAVFTDDPTLKRAIESIRDWGRDCYCAPGRDNTCRKRFKWKLGQLPEGYDHKYTYSHLGYNLKITDMQAAVGLAQLDRLEEFIAARKANFIQLRRRLASRTADLILPEATPGSDPAWFGFPITVRPESAVERASLVAHLERRRVGTRLLFAGNLLRQPYFSGRAFRVAGSLKNSDVVMNRTFWLGVYPGIDSEMLDYVGDCFDEFFEAAP